MSVLQDYVTEKIEAGEQLSGGMVAYLANLEEVAKVDKNVVGSIIKELEDQRSNLKMIASENYCSLSTQLTLGNLLTDKYAEGFPNHRYYAGCDNIDNIEAQACAEACELFGAEHAYVQPHSGADANMVAYWAILSKVIQEPWMEEMGVKDVAKLSQDDWNILRAKLGNQKLLGLDYYSGGHLTHGYRHNMSARMFDSYTYDVDKETQLLDYDAIRKQAKEIKPTIFLAGYSAYPRKVNFKIMKEIADSVGAVFMVDMAHFAGLVAGKVFQDEYDPIKWADVVTTTTHKTLRGPRGGMVLCKKEYGHWVDQGCPLVLGGPLAHSIAAKAIAFKEANTPEFQEYAQNIVKNSKVLSDSLMEKGVKLTSNGCENHLMVLDVSGFNITGRQAESAVRQAGITLNRNSLPFDPNGAWYTSGLRIGTPALTTLGMGAEEMKVIAQVLYDILSNTTANTIASGPNAGKQSKAKATTDTAVLEKSKTAISALLAKFQLYPEIDTEVLKKVLV
ncbi:MAG: glycine hydroxymethyltransferase [Lentisphaeraceae bacterium]|nr:glycine hydroxymethyltransferase [Lentisphaeraceae bacterium]